VRDLSQAREAARMKPSRARHPVVAQVNEALQQRRWMVTPRTARVAATKALTRS